MAKARNPEEGATEQPGSTELSAVEPEAWFPQLTNAQAIAVDLIVSGRKFADVARQVGVSREQVWRWRQDPVFQAAVSQQRAEMHRARTDRFWRLVDKAHGVAEESLDERDPQMATDILRVAARGMTDIREVATTGRHEGSGMERPALREGPHSEGDFANPTAHVLAQEHKLTCPACGLVARSRGGLTRHERARHRNGGGAS